MGNETIIDSRLSIRLDLSPSGPINDMFRANPRNVARLATQFLLYDQIIIPTSDFGIVPILISWMGLDNFRNALESSSIRFLRKQGVLGYSGNGVGLVVFVIRKLDPSIPTPAQGSFPKHGASLSTWWQEAIMGPTETALYLQILHGCPSVPAKERNQLIELLCKSSVEFDTEADTFEKGVCEESYLDIIQSETLQAYLLAHYQKWNYWPPRKKGRIELPNLEGLPPNQIRLLRADGNVADPIDLVLKVAEINSMLVASVQLGNATISAPDGADLLLKQKIVRTGADRTFADAFVSLLELNDIPNIEPAVMSGDISLAEIWDLRQKGPSKKFRMWLQQSGSHDPRELEKLYVKAISKPNLTERLSLKTLRFAATTAAGVVNPVVGLMAGAADSFLGDKMLSGFSPQLFLDELNSLVTLS